jgi:Ser/Thr protein kinase RdoA (MazF antagonist)
MGVVRDYRVSMMRWERLTEAGQIRRLRPLAMAALSQYEINPVRLTLVGGFTNVIFRVDTDSGPYALRVDLHQDHSDADVEIELAWLASIASDTDLDVCRFVCSRNGHSYVYASADGVPGERRCVLFEWIAGRPLGDDPTDSGYLQMGKLSAGLHVQGESFTPPYQPLTWDKVFYWPEEIDPVVVYKPEMARYLTGTRMHTLESTIEAVGSAFALLDPEMVQTIHGDLHPYNVHVFRSRLTAFDFEDVTWGHRVQDVAITLFYQRNHPGYGDLCRAFEEGYRSIARWPVTYEGELECFMAARTVMFINYVANLRDDPSDYYDVAFPRLERFLSNRG